MSDMRFMVPLRCAAVAVLLFPAVGRDSSGQAPVLGVTWSVPEDQEKALSDLVAMRNAGVRVVRTTALLDEALFAEADSLGLSFFQEIDVGYLPAGPLVDSVDVARAVLRSMLDFSARYRSARNIGFARLADTSDPKACQYFEALADDVTRSPVVVTTYYTTRFFSSDLCAHTVDGVLLELRDVSIARLDTIARATNRAGPKILGLASVGTWVDLDLDKSGVMNPNSAEWQARYLEQALDVLSSDAWASADGYVFVHRWRDPPGIEDQFADIIQRRYGLHNASGGPRPALAVLRGFASGGQTVFAFGVGQPPGTRWLWMTLTGWVFLSVMALVYATSPQMRHMVPRYFLSHGFYREAVASGRESLPAETICLLACISMGTGMLLSTFLFELSMEPLFEVARRWIDPEARNFVGAMLDQPWTLAVVLGSLYALTIVAWTSTMSFVSRAGRTLLPAQTLMLVVWSQWPLLVLLLVAPAIASSDPQARLLIAAIFVLATLVQIVASIVRTLLDFFTISQPAAVWLVVGIALHPLVILAILGIGTAFGRHADDFGYALHLLTRS